MIDLWLFQSEGVKTIPAKKPVEEDQSEFLRIRSKIYHNVSSWPQSDQSHLAYVSVSDGAWILWILPRISGGREQKMVDCIDTNNTDKLEELQLSFPRWPRLDGDQTR